MEPRITERDGWFYSHGASRETVRLAGLQRRVEELEAEIGRLHTVMAACDCDPDPSEEDGQ